MEILLSLIHIYDKDHVAGQADAEQRIHAVNAVKRAEGEQHRVHQLGQQGGAVVADPQAFAGVAEEPFRPLPDGVIGEHVEDLHDAVNSNADQHHPGRVGEDRLNGRHGPVVRAGKEDICPTAPQEHFWRKS